MRIETIKKLCCSFDKTDLKLTVISTDVQDNILEGFLLCIECKRIYPIVSGIPIMSPDEYREFKLEQPLLELWTKDNVSDSFRLISNKAENK
ncbi:Trm112 family protein [Ferruginibacter paludis]|uniref:Trm112 family protein n=1 Tax=Ferruginibacter paludis TaxID=1310417 RepID=UPI0025B3B380|nr:Trm112 family protein [Ferruginibacter paludis]MDN3657222.1 Trm112 family protein [Ferruginibacter paludis]